MLFICNFIIAADLVDLNSETDEYKDYRFTKWMTKNVGLQAIPPTAFYGKANKHLAENFVRYCFIKVIISYAYWADLCIIEYLLLQKDENLQKAAEILEKWKSGKKW